MMIIEGYVQRISLDSFQCLKIRYAVLFVVAVLESLYCSIEFYSVGDLRFPYMGRRIDELRNAFDLAGFSPFDVYQLKQELPVKAVAANDQHAVFAAALRRSWSDSRQYGKLPAISRTRNGSHVGL